MGGSGPIAAGGNDAADSVKIAVAALLQAVAATWPKAALIN